METKFCFALLATMGPMALVSLSAGAGEVTLKLKSGDISLSGELEAFDGRTYTIRSPALGLTSVWAKRFKCVAGDCPRGALRKSPSRPKPIANKTLSPTSQDTAPATAAVKPAPKRRSPAPAAAKEEPKPFWSVFFQ